MSQEVKRTCYGIKPFVGGKLDMKNRLGLCLAILLLFGAAACENSLTTWQEQYDLGIRYLSDGKYEEAIIAFTAAIEIDPKQAEPYSGIAKCYIPLGNIHAAIDWLQTGILETNSHYLEEQLAQIAYETGDYSAYVTETLISQEDLTIGGKPFYELSLEEAVLLLPETESSMVSDFEGSGMPGGKSYSVTRDDSYWGVNANSSYAIITVQQLDGHDTLSFLQYSDFYNEITIGIETGIRGIVTGDSMESVLKKIGIRADGSKYMADSLLSFYIGADNSIDGGAGWIRAEDSSTQYQDNIYARTVRIGMGDFDCQMDFVDDLLVSIDITPNNY